MQGRRFDMLFSMGYNLGLCHVTMAPYWSWPIAGRSRITGMHRRNWILLILILVVVLLAVYVDLPKSPGIHFKIGKTEVSQDFVIHQGLDLRGGLQVLLEADVPISQTLDAASMKQVAAIIDNRVNAIGVTEPLVQTQGSRRIIVELPGIDDPDKAIATIKETGLLEFVDAGNTFLPLGTEVATTYPKLESEGAVGGLITSTVTVTPAEGITPTNTVTQTSAITQTYAYPTVLTGSYLKTATSYRDSTTGAFGIQFELTDAGVKIFSDFTTAHADNDQQPYYYLAILLDKTVISCPHIKSSIPEGKGVIEGQFTLAEVQALAVQLQYGALPIPLKIETVRTVGPSLGQDSVQRSLRAGMVGLGIVLLFMLIYYRLPGLLADLALVMYGLLNLAVFKIGWPALLVIGLLLMISYLLDRTDVWALALGGLLLAAALAFGVTGFSGVTLTLPAITGFILSTGMAVDANILVFERMKEELRAGKNLNSALEAGFNRAWTSIRDSNISTLITCAILFYFGQAFAAGSVRGFAITLALGVIINLFTAITVTRTLMRALYAWRGEKLRDSQILASL
jgi:protein-export membrane protein SecD